MTDPTRCWQVRCPNAMFAAALLELAYTNRWERIPGRAAIDDSAVLIASPRTNHVWTRSTPVAFPMIEIPEAIELLKCGHCKPDKPQPGPERSWPVPADADVGAKVWVRDFDGDGWHEAAELFGVCRDWFLVFLSGNTALSTAPSVWRQAVLADPYEPDRAPPRDLKH